MDSDKDGSIDEAESRFLDLCGDVNMDKPTMEDAWQNFKEIKTKCTLEGDNLHWLICALYSSCRQRFRSMQSVSGQAVKGSPISLNTLIKKAKFSFTSFLKKMTTWMEMNPDEQLQEHINLLECNFRVSTVVFKKFSPIFLDVFRHCEPTTLEKSLKANQRPSRTNRKITCSSDDVFKFCWMLFVHAKGTECHAIAGEVLTSFQLLLCVVNLCFKNALGCSHRCSLLNPNFPGLPNGWEENDYGGAADKELPDIISLLVQRHVGVDLSQDEIQQFILQTQVLSTHTWMKYVSNLNQLEIAGAPNHFFQPQHFEANSKKLNRLYEEFVLTEGDFDERVFLEDDANNQLGTPIKPMMANNGTNFPATAAHSSDNTDIGAVSKLSIRTPLSNREYLIGKDRGGQTEIGGFGGGFRFNIAPSANSDAQKIKKMLVGSNSTPSPALLDVFKFCTEDILTQIYERLQVLSEQFTQAYSDGPDKDTTSSGVADERLVLTKMLYFHMLEKITLQEKKRLVRSDLTNLLKRDDFNNLLFTCCLEIILCTMDSNRSFPWALNALDISPYYFYKIIELVIRGEESLSASIIKHLIYVEEQILEQLAWKSDSPLWEAMDALPGDCAPLCQEVNFSYNIETIDNKQANSSPAANHPITRVITSAASSAAVAAGNNNILPLTHPRVKAVVGGDVMIRKTEASLAQDRFCSPSAGSAKRRLTFKPTTVVTTATNSMSNSGSGDTTTTPPVINLITTNTTSMVKKRIVVTPISNDSGIKNGKTFVINNSLPGGTKCTNITLVTAVPPSKVTTSIVSTNPNPPAPNSVRPKKTGSLALFWRKIYHLASVRLRHLCEQLSIGSDLPQRIWTCFEHSISINKAALMKNRHLDQLLMCAVYVMAKVSRHEQSFQEIMRCYRSQPQATSNVYRNVLISSKPGENGEELEDRDDLIQFYNKIYVPEMRDYVKKFSTSTNDPNKLEVPVPCSPMPRQRTTPHSPRKVSNHNVYVSPMKSRPCVSPSTGRLEYNFQRSPSKHLQQINKMLQAHTGCGGDKPPPPHPVVMNGKRSLPFTNGTAAGDHHSSSPRKQQRLCFNGNN